MKRLFLVIPVVILLVLSIAGCGPVAPVGGEEGAEEEQKGGFTFHSDIAKEPEEEDALSWDEAKNHIGEDASVMGLIVDTRVTGKTEGGAHAAGGLITTCLYMGNAYPNPDRFEVTIQGYFHPNFPPDPHEYYLGKTIYVYGLIQVYGGIPQIIASRSEHIKVKE